MLFFWSLIFIYLLLACFMPGPKRSTLQAMLVRLANGTDGDHIMSDDISGTSVTPGVIDIKTDALCDANVSSKSTVGDDLSSLSGLGPSLNSFLNIGAPLGHSQAESDENGMLSTALIETDLQ